MSESSREDAAIDKRFQGNPALGLEIVLCLKGGTDCLRKSPPSNRNGTSLAAAANGQFDEY